MKNNLNAEDRINLQTIYSTGIEDENHFKSACKKIEQLMDLGEDIVQANIGHEWDLCNLFNAIIVYENNLYPDWAIQMPYCYCKSIHKQGELNKCQ